MLSSELSSFRSVTHIIDMKELDGSEKLDQLVSTVPSSFVSLTVLPGEVYYR